MSYASTTGAGPNIIYGLALGYKSVIVPVVCIARESRRERSAR